MSEEGLISKRAIIDPAFFQSLLLKRAGIITAVAAASNAHFSELHYIAGKRARFIGKDVADHSQLLVEIGALDFRREVLSFVEYHDIPLYEERLDEFHDFESHDQRDRHEVRK